MKRLLKIIILPLLVLGLLYNVFASSDILQIKPRIKSTSVKVDNRWTNWSMWTSVSTDLITYKISSETFVIRDNDNTHYFRMISELDPKEDRIGRKTRTFYCENSNLEPCTIKIVSKNGSKTSEVFIELEEKKIKYVYVN